MTIRTGVDHITEAALDFEIDSVESYWAKTLFFLSKEFQIDAKSGPDFLRHVANLQDVSRPKRRLAKKIVSNMIPLIEVAIRMQLDIFAKPYDRLSDSESIQDAFSRRMSVADTAGAAVQDRAGSDALDNHPHSTKPDVDVDMVDATPSAPTASGPLQKQDQDAHDIDKDFLDGDSVLQLNQELAADAEKIIHTNTPPASTDGVKKDLEVSNSTSVLKSGPVPDPPTPPLSMQGRNVYRIGHGGIPWFAQAFDPDGLVLHDERWTGRELVRDMSEELSEMGDDELQDLGGIDFANEAGAPNEAVSTPVNVTSESVDRKKATKARRRYRGLR